MTVDQPGLPLTLPLTLHGYFRSSTSFRVRMALNLKGLRYAQKTYDLRQGQQRGEAYLAENPQGLVPTLELGDGTRIPQSMAIMEWLEEAVPEPALMPATALQRARVRSLADMVALDTHPLNNLRVLNYLRGTFGADDEAVATWFRHWAGLAFGALETRLAGDPQTGRYCHGDEPTIADICLVAQSINNRRFQVDETPYPTIRRIVAACLDTPAIQDALPDRQPDAD